MRISIPSIALASLMFVVACSDGSSSSNDGGGGSGGGDGGATSSTHLRRRWGRERRRDQLHDRLHERHGHVIDDLQRHGTTTTTTTTTEGNGCESAGSEPVLFSTNVQPIFSQSCGSATTCHLKAAASEGLSLKPGSSYAALVDVNAKQSCNGQKRVQPGSAAGSYLVNKITATDVCPTTKKMPPQSSLSAASKQTIIDWICQGALNN